MEEWYGILELDPDNREEIDTTQIRKSYYAMAKKFHPDKAGDHDKFIKIQQAYQILSDPCSRSRYDKLLETTATRTTSFWEDMKNGLLLELAMKIPLKQQKSADISAKLTLPRHIRRHEFAYTAYRHRIIGSVVTLQPETVRAAFEIPEDFCYGDEYLTVEGWGNDVVDGDGRIKRGDLLIDILLEHHDDGCSGPSIPDPH